MALKLLCCCASIRIKRTTIIKLSRGFYLSNGIVGIICYNILRVKSFFVIVFLQKQFEDAKLSAVVSEVVSQTPAPTTQAAGPPPSTAVSSMAYKYLVFEQQLEGQQNCYHSHLLFQKR